MVFGNCSVVIAGLWVFKVFTALKTFISQCIISWSQQWASCIRNICILVLAATVINVLNHTWINNFVGRLRPLQPRWEVGRTSWAARRGEVPFAEMSHSREGNLIHLIHDTGDFGCSIANERGCCCCSSDISRRKLALWSSLNSLEPSSVHACVVREKSTALAVELVLQTRSGAALGFGGLYCSLIGKAPASMESLYVCALDEMSL